MKNFLSMLILLLMMSTVALAADDAETKSSIRLARLPIIILSSRPDEEAMAGLEVKVSRAVHLPLNGTLRAIDYIPIEESTEAMQDVWKKLYKNDRKSTLQDAMEPLAKKLDADVIVCPVLRQYSQQTMINTGLSAESENRLISRASVELIVFERVTNELTVKRETKSYNGEDAAYGTARFLADECMTRVIETTELRDRVLSYTPIGKKHTVVERKPVER